jgi:hypothetical protein
MINWLLSWFIPDNIALEGSKTPLEALKSSKEYPSNPKA